MTQPGETDGFDAVDHLERVLETVPGGVDMILVHEGPLDPHWAGVYAAKGQEPVAYDARRLEALGVRVVAADLADRGRLVRHSPEALAGRSGGAGRRGAGELIPATCGDEGSGGHATVATNRSAAVDSPPRDGARSPSAVVPATHVLFFRRRDLRTRQTRSERFT